MQLITRSARRALHRSRYLPGTLRWFKKIAHRQHRRHVRELLRKTAETDAPLLLRGHAVTSWEVD